MRAPSLQSPALRYFLAVAEAGSLAGASRTLHVAASAISRQVAGLERDLGQPLFDRMPRGMELTPAGEILAAYARRVGQEADRALQDVLALDDVHAGTVRVAASEGFTSHLLPRAMAAFRQRYPEVAFVLDRVAPATVAARVRHGDADLGVAYQLGEPEGVRAVYRERVAAQAMMRADHPLAGQRQVTLRQILAYPVAVPDARTTLRQILDAACARLHLPLEPALATNAMTALHAFVAAGGGITVLSDLSLRDARLDADVVCLPLRERLLPTRVFAVQVQEGRTLAPAAAHFLQFLVARLAGDPCHNGKGAHENR